MGSVTPLYQRLPRGPHRLGATEVARNQRIRMYGAMVEAVAAVGYQHTSVKQVISLAGVSRRAFYEQFANKEECFLAAFDLIVARWVKRINEAYLSADGALEDRLHAAFAEYGEEVHANWKGAALVMLEAQTAGSAGLLHVRRAAITFERMLSSSFAHAPAACPLPIPVVRGIVGGIHEIVASRLREGRAKDVPTMTDELVGWTLLFDAPAAERMSASLGRRMTARLAEQVRSEPLRGRIPHAEGERYLLADNRSGEDRHALAGDPSGFGLGAANGGESEPPRARLLTSVLRLAVREDYQELSAPQISQAAGVPIEVFFQLFANRTECFLAAFDLLCEELFRVVSGSGPASADWPSSVRQTIGRLMVHLADHPLCAKMIAAEAFAAGPDAIERNVKLVRDIATLLTEGAPTPPLTPLALEGVTGAIFHTVRCQVISGQTQLLPVLSDYLSYVVLAPFVGADAAAEILAEEEPAGV
ncbi:MAG TPA: TetR/AcrR family transcriptional regulator [Solirubrobacteraceae bacterium]|jgi:AcrR family transcriptional regulator